MCLRWFDVQSKSHSFCLFSFNVTVSDGIALVAPALHAPCTTAEAHSS